MAFQIDEEILRQTTECQHNFKCLDTGDCPGCEAESKIGDGHVFVKMNENQICPYKMSFGPAYICSCPTRCEIYRKYNI